MNPEMIYIDQSEHGDIYLEIPRHAAPNIWEFGNLYTFAHNPEKGLYVDSRTTYYEQYLVSGSLPQVPVNRKDAVRVSALFGEAYTYRKVSESITDDTKLVNPVWGINEAGELQMHINQNIIPFLMEKIMGYLTP